jgi:arsenite methyltransferase
METLTQPIIHQSSDAIKSLVREKYAEVAMAGITAESGSCCGPACGCGPNDGIATASIMNEDYSQRNGYIASADLSLGCGIPTDIANIRAGDTVLDLGSGAGNDVFVARSIVGDGGKVIGVDFTDAMIHKARLNAHKLGFKNVEFRAGDIEQLPVLDGEADVVVSNCVLNLVPNKRAAFAEMYRALRTGGHFSVSDIVLRGELPTPIHAAAELYAGCVSGAIQHNEYLALLAEVGFTGLRVAKERVITLPDSLLEAHFTPAELAEFRSSGANVVSITVYGEKA